MIIWLKIFSSSQNLPKMQIERLGKVHLCVLETADQVDVKRRCHQFEAEGIFNQYSKSILRIRNPVFSCDMSVLMFKSLSNDLDSQFKSTVIYSVNIIMLLLMYWSLDAF